MTAQQLSGEAERAPAARAGSGGSNCWRGAQSSGPAQGSRGSGSRGCACPRCAAAWPAALPVMHHRVKCFGADVSVYSVLIPAVRCNPSGSGHRSCMELSLNQLRADPEVCAGPDCHGPVLACAMLCNQFGLGTQEIAETRNGSKQTLMRRLGGLQADPRVCFHAFTRT